MSSSEDSSKSARDAHARKILKQLEGASMSPRVELSDWPDPLWIFDPHTPRYSIGWRMGPREDYADDFAHWFVSLPDEKRKKYIAEYPEPKTWEGYYELILERLK